MSGNGDKKRDGVPGRIVFLLYTPLTQKVTNRFSFFSEDAPLIFGHVLKKARKYQEVFFLISPKNIGGGQNLPPPPPSQARVNE